MVPPCPDPDMVRHTTPPGLLSSIKSALYTLLPQVRCSHPSLPAGLTNSHQSSVPASRGTSGLRSSPHPFCLVLRERCLLKCEPEHLHRIYWPLERICPHPFMIRPLAPGTCPAAPTRDTLPSPSVHVAWPRMSQPHLSQGSFQGLILGTPPSAPHQAHDSSPLHPQGISTIPPAFS